MGEMHFCTHTTLEKKIKASMELHVVEALARPAGMLYNPCASPSVVRKLKYSQLLNHMIYFDQSLHFFCMSTLSNHWHAYQPFVMDGALLSISPADHGQLV